MQDKSKLTHSPSKGQKSAQLPYLEKVQHPKEKSRAESFFTKLTRTVTKVYLCEKNLGGLVAL